MLRRTAAATAVALLVVLSSLAFADGRAMDRSPAGSSLQLPAGLVTDSVPVPHGARVTPLPASAPLITTVTLGWSNSSALETFLKAVETPTSPQYRHFLTYSEFVDRFSPSESAVQAVESTLLAHGARDLTVSPDRALVGVTMTAGELEALLDVSLVEYGRSGALPLFTAVGDPTLPSGWTGLVDGLGGLSDEATASYHAPLVTSRLAPVPLRADSRDRLGPTAFIYDNVSDVDFYVGSDYAQAYLANQLWPGTATVNDSTYPKGTAVATLLASSYNESSALNLPPWDPSVVDAYFNATLSSAWPKPVLGGVPVQISGAPTPPLPGSLGNWTDSTDDEIENSLDLEMVGSLAPGATVKNFYFPASLLNGTPSFGNVADYFAQDLAAALAYDYAPANLSVVSGSFGLPDLSDSAWDHELAVAAATGVTVVLASGDGGDAPNSAHPLQPFGQWPLWPASAAFNTTGSISVGGVTLTLAGAPTGTFSQGPLNVSNLTYDSHVATVNGSAFTTMGVWYDQNGSAAVGSEGGLSSVYDEPWWQVHSAAQPNILNASKLEGGGVSGRAGPDLALPANRTIAFVLANATGTVFYGLLQGTSIAAPVLAGELADVVAVESLLYRQFHPLGYIDPELYRIASYYAVHRANVTSDPFYDVVDGSNYVFPAGPGWDAATGWGGLLAPRFYSADLNPAVRNYSYVGSNQTIPTPSSGGGYPWTTIYLVAGLGIAAVLMLIVYFVRSRSNRFPPHVPPGAENVPWGTPPGPVTPGGGGPSATFVCPYCGADRPAEPVRCPKCGSF